MRFGVIGLGHMGGNLARLAIDKGHEVVGFNQDEDVTRSLADDGLEPATTIEALVEALPRPRRVFLYVPHGDPTEEVCNQLQPLLESGDVVVDGGNSHWEDSERRHGFFAESSIHFLDVGTSGGVSGARQGACFMAGGERDAYDLVEPLLRDLAVDGGAYYVGPSGSGHFSKLVHNAIEFGMVQAIAEGVEMLRRSDYELDLPGLFDNWNHGSVIRGWLVELMGKGLQEHPDLAELSTYVEDTAEVKWVLNWANDHDIPTPVTTISQVALMQYRDLHWPMAKAVAILRNQYGGHPIHKEGEDAGGGD